ncbi:class I SAM-dependent methyltransferase [Salinimonas chungwhensis]|uniref:class I SAM-dependent methyltransferase n=1 Tax=Salinimonas chungwhensis TaxID=265425 RepID=UPI00037D6DA2|nr:class I SAM-dependent methyltransferase [Salinimonas chungwhensis]
MALQLVTDSSHEKKLLERYISSRAKPDSTLQILEAGCGNKWQLALPDLCYSLSGVDLDEEALLLRQRNHNDLDTVIVGDLRSVNLPEHQYDIIYTAYVLEHVADVPRVLDNFNRWLKPGGLLVIKVPDRDTVYGFVARNTPHWLHVYYYRWIKGNKNAGKPGYLPYPTVYDKALGRHQMTQFCHREGLHLMAMLGKNNYLRKRSARDRAIRVFVRLIHLFSFGRLAWHYNDLIFIIEKPTALSDEHTAG